MNSSFFWMLGSLLFKCTATSNKSKTVCHFVKSSENFLISISGSFMLWLWCGVGERATWGMNWCKSGGLSGFNMIELILIMTSSISISKSSALFW